MDLPQLFIYESADDEASAAVELARRLDELGVSDPFVLASRHGQVLAAALDGHPAELHDGTADQDAAAALGSRAKRAGAGAIVAIGGGRCLDIAKLAAARAGLAVIAVPTQLSHDGICSPVAVVPNASGVKQSLGAVAPKVVFVPLPTIVRAPVRSAAAGIGDLIANPLALRDWALASSRALDQIDPRAWDLAVESYELIEPLLGRAVATSANDPAFYRRLAEALVLSGYAMLAAGSSRPASGGEHEVSHAMDEIFGGLALHGEQVALGCVVSVALYGEDAAAFRSRLRTLGLPDSPRALGMSNEDMVRVILEAPNTRPGRFTILEEADLDDRSARRLVERIWEE